MLKGSVFADNRMLDNTSLGVYVGGTVEFFCIIKGALETNLGGERTYQGGWPLGHNRRKREDLLL